MKFSFQQPLSFPYNNQQIEFFVQGDPTEEKFCITCSYTLFVERFSGETKCFHPFISAPFIPNETDENYAFFESMKMTILKAHSQLKP